MLQNFKCIALLGLLVLSLNINNTDGAIGVKTNVFGISVEAGGGAIPSFSGTHIDGLGGRTELTVEYWARFPSIGDMAVNKGFLFWYGVDNTNFVGYDGNGLLNASKTTLNDFASDTNLWFHFSYIRSGDSAELIVHHQSGDIFARFTNMQPSPSNIGSLGSFSFGFPPSENDVYQYGLTSNIGTLVSEIKVWNLAKTQSQIEFAMFRPMNMSDADGLLAYWSFDGPDYHTPTFSSTSISMLDNLGQGPYEIIEAIDNPPPLNYRVISVPFDGSANLNYPDLQATLTVLNSTFTPRLCAGQNADNCTAPGVLDDLNSYIRPSRDSCDKYDLVKIGYVNPDNLEVLRQSATIEFTVGGFVPGSLTSLTASELSTEGGELGVVSNGNLGINGPLGNLEYLQMNFTRGGLQNCTDPRVAGSTLYCTIPPGIGAITSFETRLCGDIRTFTTNFNYSKPVVTGIQRDTLTAFYVLGSNFGPETVTEFVTVTVNGTLWTIESKNHTEVRIVAPTSTKRQSGVTQLTDRAWYQVVVNVDGLVSSLDFNYTLCDTSCGVGICTGANKCDCSGTGFGGSTCERALVCDPDCKEGGICTENPDPSLQPYCFCGIGVDKSSRAPDCTTANSSKGALIGGVVGGAGGLLVLIVAALIVIYIVRRRYPKRGGANFVPLEKKDFTKIIYGEQLDQTVEKTQGDLKGLEQLLLSDDLRVVNAICNITQITEADQISKALVLIFQENDKVIHLLKSFISEEVNTSETAGTLFRSNSMVSKMFKFYSRLIGLPYLYETVGPELTELIEDEVGLEVDPEKMEEGTDLDEMRWTLMAQSQKILKAIFLTVDKCPQQFQEIFEHLKHCVDERFPEKAYTTIGGFIFLRFFCPAISTPEAYGIVEEPPTASARRMLILITKVLQNLSNDVEFGSKEPYMTKLNDFIHSNRVKLTDFYNKLLKSNKSQVSIDVPKNMKPISLAVVSAHVKDNLSKIEDEKIRSQLEAVVN